MGYVAVYFESHLVCAGDTTPHFLVHPLAWVCLKVRYPGYV
jgi:hypothetical protein